MHTNRILIVDDNVKNIQVLANTLSNNNDYEIEYATNGKDALVLVESEELDLILLDVMMPEMDGFTVCNKIKETHLKSQIPIIFITAKTDTESIAKAFDVGGVDYITKPFNEQELLARVKTHLELKNHKDKLEDLVNLRNQQLEIAYKELETLDDAKSEFLNMLSHELRTPLNGIVGFVSLMKSTVESESLKEYLSHLDLSAKRLETFSLRALMVTSLRTKKQKPIFKRINFNKVLEEVLNLFKQDLKEKSIRVKTKIESHNLKLEADQELTEAALREIIHNVLIHGSSANEILVKGSVKENQFVIDIIDNGKGFSSKALSSLFMPFGFGQEHIDKKVGLGLHIAKLAFENQGFEISAGNNKDKGAFVRLIMKEM